ncbi:hypothetical protein XPA_003078 [Xanthoria parietina]
MPAAQQASKAQPWKAHWPPRDQQDLKQQGLGFKEGQTMVLDGDSGDWFLEKGCSKPKTVTVSDTKAQPWKAHWPPRDQQDLKHQGLGFEKGQMMVLDGDSGDWFLEKGCSKPKVVTVSDIKN